MTLVEGLVEAAKKDGVENVRVVAEEIERRFKRGNGALGSA